MTNSFKSICDDENQENVLKALNGISKNEYTSAGLFFVVSSNPAPSFYKKLHEALQHNSNITSLTIEGSNFIKCIPDDAFEPIL